MSTAAVTVGVQTPRIMHVPPYVSSTGSEALELCALAGLNLDPWQALVLEHALGEGPDGAWAAFEIGVNVPRQNGKGTILEARQLVGLFLLEEAFQVHSAHQVDTSLEAFRRLLELIEGAPDLDRQVLRVSHTNGRESIELRNGCRIRFRSRSRGGGRGFSGEVLYLDEAMFLPEFAVGALMPALSSKSMRGNPQIWYAGSAVDAEIHEHGLVFSRLRARALKGGDPSLAWFEWSVEAEGPLAVSEQMATDPDLIAQANPGLGIRISLEHVLKERRSMDPRTYGVERLGAGDWHDPSGSQDLISAEAWADLAAAGPPFPQITDRVVFAFDVSPDRRASIAVAGQRGDGVWQVEIAAARQGTGWLIPWLATRVETHEPAAVVCDARGPGAGLVTLLAEAGVDVVTFDAGEYAQACGRFLDAVAERSVRHLGSGELAAAIKGAKTRPLGDAFAWSRKNSGVDISPLVAATLALSKALDTPETDDDMTIW